MVQPGAGPFGSALDWLALLVWLLAVYWQPSLSFGSASAAWRSRRRKYEAETAAAAAATRVAIGGGGGGGGRVEQQEQQQRAPVAPVRVTSTSVLLDLVLSPPGWLFGIVWTVLYALMAVAAFVYWRRGSPDIADPMLRLELRVTTLVAVLVNLVLNKLWTPLYFGAGQRAVALVVALGILATNIWVLVEFFTQTDHASQTAGYLWLPYTLWSAYAVLLNAVRVGRRRVLI